MSALCSAQSAVTGAPAQLTSQARGNPLAAGLIAFGVGLLAGSLLPTSAAEQQAATKVKDAATPSPVRCGEGGRGQPEGAGPARGRRGQGHGHRRGGDGQGRGHVSAAQDVKAQAQDAKDTVAQQ